ncbi:hypothetical protein AVEN_37814-1 [Araneus ventricosus]|uniref:Uncharacterized protein n=1 Tax=Araneus ventricosus TaxID=182803 RepID=A0A4Y2G8W5_ARAVE|nr:hypothetical protein AVEN_37814-1 [Araneus ventricosus]
MTSGQQHFARKVLQENYVSLTPSQVHGSGFVKTGSGTDCRPGPKKTQFEMDPVGKRLILKMTRSEENFFRKGPESFESSKVSSHLTRFSYPTGSTSGSGSFEGNEMLLLMKGAGFFDRHIADEFIREETLL